MTCRGPIVTPSASDFALRRHGSEGIAWARTLKSPATPVLSLLEVPFLTRVLVGPARHSSIFSTLGCFSLRLPFQGCRARRRVPVATTGSATHGARRRQ